LASVSTRGADRPVRLVSTSGPFSVTRRCARSARPGCRPRSPPSSRRPGPSPSPHGHHRLDRQHHAGTELRAAPGSPKFGICGSSCSARPIPWPTNARTTANPWPPRATAPRATRPRGGGRAGTHGWPVQTLAGDVEELLHLRGHRADRQRERAVGVVPFDDTPEVEPHDVARLDLAPGDGMPCTTSSLIEMQAVAGTRGSP
jgi:hypothetical protein